MKVQNKVIVVTGAGGGTGRELVYSLFSKGATDVSTSKNLIAGLVAM